MTRTCEAWLSELAETSLSRAQAVADLHDLLRRSLARAFAGKLPESDLDDLTQESVLRIHERLGSFQQRSRFTTWAIAIAVNVAYSELRRRRHRHVSLDDAMRMGAAALVLEPAQAPAPDLEATLHEGIRTALTERQREAMLALLGGLPLAEIAQRTGVKQGAIYKLLHDARQRLKHYLLARAEGTLGAASLGVMA